MRYLFFIVFMLLSCVTFSQKATKLSEFVSHLIVKGAKVNAYDSTPRNFAHFFSIALSFDAEGKIDTLYYSSKLNPETKYIIRFDNSLLDRIKIHNFTFKEYSLKIVLFSYYSYRMSDHSIDYKTDFLNSVANLIPEAVFGKPIISLKPIVDASLPKETN